MEYCTTCTHSTVLLVWCGTETRPGNAVTLVALLFVTFWSGQKEEDDDVKTRESQNRYNGGIRAPDDRMLYHTQ
jgi:hypothetical protein